MSRCRFLLTLLACLVFSPVASAQTDQPQASTDPPTRPVGPHRASTAQSFGQQDDISVIAVTRTASLVPA